MKKTVYDLTKDDWNRLFPVELLDHNPEWKTIYKAEKAHILQGIDSKFISHMEHFGSTSIPNIKAKPYIDIIIETPKEFLFDQALIDAFEKLGYVYFKVPERENFDAYMSFGKGYNLEGPKAQIFHIHMCSKDNMMWQQIGFRDYLIANPESAKAYEDLKIDLATTHKNDRGAYVLLKTDFINNILKLLTEQNKIKDSSQS